MDKEALRKKRLDEIDEEEGMLGNERMHGAGERGEMLDDPEIAFEPEDEVDNEIVNFQTKKDKKRDRLREIMERHRLLKERQNAPAAEPERVFEETIPDGGVTQAEEVAAETATEPEAFVEETNEEGELADRKQGVDSDEAFDKNLFLPLDELRILAETFAEDYGYTGEPGEYVMPASAKLRSDLKALLIRIYDRLKTRTGGKFDKANKLEAEIKEVDTLNDLEIRHALNYYKKIDTIEKRKEQKAQTLAENEAE